ncbi:MAG: hypothetical protein ABEK03_05185 [Candidatus Bipolaricaulia bacterium]
MQQLLIVLLIGAAFAGVLFFAGGFEPASPLAPATSTEEPAATDEADATATEATTAHDASQQTTTEPAAPTTGNRVHLEIGRVVTWNGSPVEIPLWVEGNPQELDFVVRFPNHLARVLAVSSSANWNTDIVRLNEEGEIRVHAVRQSDVDGEERLLTMTFRRIDAGSASLTIPVDELEADFAVDEPYDARVESGLLTAPF